MENFGSTRNADFFKLNFVSPDINRSSSKVPGTVKIHLFRYFAYRFGRLKY